MYSVSRNWSTMLTVVFYMKLILSGLLLNIENVTGQLLQFKKDIEVPIGREVFLKPTDLIFHDVALNEICKVETITNEPISQRVGLFESQVFDCNFKYKTVKYTHYGSPLLSHDAVKLRAYKFTKNDTVVEYFNLVFVIQNVSYHVIQPIRNLIVKEYFGLTDIINETVLNFNFSRNEGATCKARVSHWFHNRPAHGQIIGRDKRPVDVIKRKCDEFLDLGLRYEHLKPPSPNVDYILIVIEVIDPFINHGELVLEFYHLPVEIIPGFPNLPPKASFSGMYLMDVDQFIITAITPEVLSATDSETPHDKLIFNISQPLLHHQGSLVHLSDHTRPISSFRQFDLNNFNIAYRPPSKSFKERQMFEVVFVIYDSDFEYSDPCTLHIAVRPAVTKAPRVLINTGMTLLEGQSRPLTLKNLEIVDSDNINDVQIFVIGGLQHGKLEVGKRPGVSFTQKDIILGRVVYHHDDSDSTKDTIHLRIYDGSQSTYAKFPISIISKDDSAPVLIVNIGIKVREKETVQINHLILRAADHDTADENINFLVTAPPTSGNILKKQVWEKEGKKILQFTQRDVNKGSIYYQHLNNQEFIDRFDVIIQDTNNPPNTSPPYSVTVHVSPIGNDPPKRDPSCSFFLEVRETDLGLLESKLIRFLDVDSLDKEIIYTIMGAPKFIGSLAHIDSGKIVSLADQATAVKNLHLLPVATFTQQHINHHKIAYMPPTDDIGPYPLYLQFVFSVSDKHGNTVTGQIFNITIIPVNNQVPQLHTGELLVEEGSSTLISTNELSVYDPDTLTSDLQMSLFTIPLHGSVHRSGQPLRVGDLLSLNDILTLRLEYIHDDSENFEDQFKVGVNDGLHFISGKVCIKVEPIDDEMPIWQLGLSQRISVEEGGSVVLSSQVLAASDVDTEPASLFFILTEVPQYGNIVVDNKKTTRFTQGDVSKNGVTYMHNGLEIGPNPKEDSLTFIVTDKAFPRLIFHSSHKVFATILPKNTRPPRISFKRAILVEEGKQAVIAEEHISASDEDTFTSELLIVISKQPMHGYLQNLKPVSGYEKSNFGKRITAFPFQDVRNGFIHFVQSDHRNIEPESDGFEIFVTDGVHNSSSVFVFISIIFQNDEEPIFFLPNITVEEGNAYIFNSTSITATDLDFPGDFLVISVKSSPKFGMLLHKIQTINKGPFVEVPFSQLGIDSFENVVYHHGGLEEFADQFTLVLSDGVHNVVRTVYVDIIPVNDELPHVVKNIGAKCNRKPVDVLITGAILLVEDYDTPPENLVYKLLSPFKHGFLQKKQKPTEEKAIWINVDNFSQFDVDMNLIRYWQGNETPYNNDSFNFVVTDGVHETKPEVFLVKVIPDGKVNLNISSSGAVIEAGSQVIINSSMLNAWDESVHYEDIMFHVIQKPRIGIIALSSDFNVLLKNFSLLDLFNGKVMYKHNNISAVGNDSIMFMVGNGLVSKNITFAITVLPSNDLYSFYPSLKTIFPLEIEANGLNLWAITKNNLFSVDQSVPENEVIYIIVNYPKAGFLMYDGKRINNSFTQEAINKNLIFYRNTESQNMSKDVFSFKVSNGKKDGYIVDKNLVFNSTLFEIHFKEKIALKEITISVSSPDYLETILNGQKGYILRQSNINASHFHYQRNELEFHVVKNLQNGIIYHTKKDKHINSFSQEDIDNGFIAIILKQDNHTKDYLTFHLSARHENFDKEYRIDLEWSAIYFTQPEYVVCENVGSVDISIHRKGNLDHSSFVRIGANGLTAKENLDYISGKINLIQFDPGVSEALWKLVIIEDSLEESPIEQLQLVLSHPENAVITVYRSSIVSIYDVKQGTCSPHLSYESDSAVGKTTSVSTRVKYYQQNNICSKEIYGLLQYNYSTESLFQCDGNHWILWNPMISNAGNLGTQYKDSSSEYSVTTPTNTELLKKSDFNFSALSFKQPTLPDVNVNEDPSSDCAKGWDSFGNVCYKWHKQQLTWELAKRACENYNLGQLASVTSSTHNNWLVEFAHLKPFWIGLHASSTGNSWVYNIAEKASFVNWKKGFPRLSSQGEMKHRCVLVKNSGHWINRQCDFHENSFICMSPASI